MNTALLLLAAQLLDMAAAEYADHGCNDFTLPEAFAEEDRVALALLMNRANFRDRSPSTWPESDIMTSADLRRNAPDFTVMGALAFMLRELAGQPGPRRR